MEHQAALELLPDEALISIFVSMTIEQLETFMMQNPRTFTVAAPVMKEKLMLRENQRKLAIKNAILNFLPLIPGQVIDLTYFDQNRFVFTMMSNMILQHMFPNYVQIGQYPLIVSQDRYNEMADIMNTVPMVPIYHK